MAGHEVPFTEMYQTRERGGPKSLARNGGAGALERGKGMKGKTWVFTFRMNSKTGIRFAASCGPTIVGTCHTRQQTKTNDEKLVERSGK